MKYFYIFGGGAIRGIAYIGALKALKELNERLENKNSLFMYLTECQRYAVEEFVGQLPPYTGFNNFIYRMSQMGLTAVENSHAK